MKKVLITGANSYIGESVREYLNKWPNDYVVNVKSTFGWTPSPDDFVGFDVVFNVAGIAHIKETTENRHLYYEVNRDLAVNIAKTAKQAGVKQYILLSTMSVYGLLTGHIRKDTTPNPINAYGKSKLAADEAIAELANDSFKFCCLRPPMVYGKGCKGNYQRLRKLALSLPVFPDYNNQRSMIYIGNLCEFIKNCVECELSGLFFPENEEYVCTSKMVKCIAAEHGIEVRLTKLFNWAIKGLASNMIKKSFGNLTYDKSDVVGKHKFEKSIELTEK